MDGVSVDGQNDQSNDKNRIKAACNLVFDLIGPCRLKGTSKLPFRVQKLPPGQYKRWWENQVGKDSDKFIKEAPLPEDFQADYEKRLLGFVRQQDAQLAQSTTANICSVAKRILGMKDDIAESLLRLPRVHEVLHSVDFDVGSIGLRCPHCCAQFETTTQATAHADYCTQNTNKMCSFCTQKCVTLDAKRNHEAVCACNPALWCEWCNVKFPHQALRDKHKRRCIQDPCKSCSFCSTKLPTRAARFLHEAFCSEEFGNKAEQGECISCAEDTRCIRFPCGEHLYCGPCILRMASFALKDRSKLPLRCCKQYVQPGDTVDLTIARILSESNRTIYQEVMLQKVSKVVMYCPSVTCGALIALDEIPKTDMDMSGPHGCPKCQQALCFDCKSEWHAGMTCARYQFMAAKTADETTQFCRQMGWMQCFECGHVVEKKGGCNHISCFCGAQFCYLCGTKWGDCKCQVMGGQHALRHNRVNATLSRHFCPFCRQPYPSREEMRAHQRTCRSRLDQIGGAYECASCLERFQNEQQVRVHRRSCRAAKRQTFECPECFNEHLQITRFARIFSKMLEMTAEHTVVPPPPQPQPEEAFEVCATVQFRFDSQEILRRHRRMCGSQALCGGCQ